MASPEAIILLVVVLLHLKHLAYKKNDFKSNLMKMIEASKEEMNESFKK